MTHDPLCLYSRVRNPEQVCWLCVFIQGIRADERRRVAERVRIPRDVSPPDGADVFVPLADVLALLDEVQP